MYPEGAPQETGAEALTPMVPRRSGAFFVFCLAVFIFACCA